VTSGAATVGLNQTRRAQRSEHVWAWFKSLPARSGTAQFTTRSTVGPDMEVIGAADKLEVLGVLVGAFLVVAALGTLVGTPWTTNNDALASAIQIVGVAAMIAVGIGLAWLSYERQ